ncbi:GUN4 domain-containing protein [Prochlorococcus sp. MIT 1300]|uniref:GUN4 domain-containing protein n=1 Tax=Prochlorococcus sp. MIT 1300 TaxID=3096218 RepID=UPI002A74B98E|nr:GUN4 domain-containing protein [Prochlorococcus sp. MIT 1300]
MPSDSSTANNPSIEELLERFSKGSPRQRRGLVETFEQRVEDIAALGKASLENFDREGDDWGAGWILQILKRHKPDVLETILTSQPSGWFVAHTSQGIDFGPLQDDLLSERFEEADRYTSAILRKLAGVSAEKRGYVYFSEVESISGVDLVTLDRLWVAYSQGRFGFSVQSRLLKALDGRYDRLWPRIGWKKDGVWTRYPGAFTWSLSAPEGHMPLVNQLRGVRLMDAILSHPSLTSR